MSITKIAKMTTEITADYQKLSDLNVAFYNQDINTSILQFNVTRNDAPVPLGKTNVDGYIVLLHEDGSRIQDNLVIVDEMEGAIQYTIPREFLKHTGKVLGQVYVAVKGVDDTAVMRQFSFDIEQDLMTAFSSTKKLEYIKTFDDLQTKIKQRVEAIEEAISNGEDYVAQMIETLDTGKKEIAATVVKANADINKVATGATKNITDTSNTAVATVNAKGDAVLKTFAENGQTSKITSDNGTSLTLNNYDLLNIEDIKNFDGYVTKATNSPTVVNDGYLKRKYRTGYIEVAYSPYNANVTYRNAYHFGTKVWFGWEKIISQSDTSTYQKQKITNDAGDAKVYLSGTTTDVYAELLKLEKGFYSAYIGSTAANSAESTVRGYVFVQEKGRWISVSGVGSNNKTYSLHFADGTWTGWESAVKAQELTAIKPVTLWQGSANSVSDTAYNLTAAINTFRVAMVTYKTASGNNKVQTFSVATDSNRIVISETNIADADASSALIYKCRIDTSASTSFKIIADNIFNIKTSVATTDANTHTILKIEGVM